MKKYTPSHPSLMTSETATVDARYPGQLNNLVHEGIHGIAPHNIPSPRQVDAMNGFILGVSKFITLTPGNSYTLHVRGVMWETQNLSVTVRWKNNHGHGTMLPLVTDGSVQAFISRRGKVHIYHYSCGFGSDAEHIGHLRQMAGFLAENVGGVVVKSISLG